MANIMRLGGGGKKPSGTRSITANGTYDVAEYATANVNVQSAPVLLWTNASPTSSFGYQTVTLNGSGYDGYLVEIKTGNAAAVCYVPFFNEAYGKSVAMTTFSMGNYINQGRLLDFATSDGILFGIGVWGNKASTSYNGYAIPTRIWGVKFTIN